MNPIRLLLATAIAFAMPIAFAQQAVPGAPARAISFEQDVHPILTARCYQCHGGGLARGGLRMDTRELFLKGSDHGPVAVEGNSPSSRLIQLVSGLDDKLVMPPKEPRLTPEQIDILRLWIDQGIVWDFSKPTVDTWEAPIAPRRPEVPNLPGIHGSIHPVDRFIARYFGDKGIDAPALIPDSVFARRAWLDATGLLPATAQLEEFIERNSVRKRQTLVRELLASDRDYAEHWIGFWNDALRNDFQGTGYIDGGRKQITGWLYEALYYNKPYDLFVQELIHPAESSRGFSDGIVWRGVVPAAELPPVQAARSVSQVFLGVNLKCASCHDSFIDNWKLTDSYGMAAFFSTDALELVRCDVPTGKKSMTKFLWPELGGVDEGLSRGERTKALANIVTSPENGRFARTIVNRVWAQLMGRGLVEPLDDMGRRPWDPDLLDWLAADFVDNEYDLRKLLWTIMSSKAYQLASEEAGPIDPKAPYAFQGPLARRMTAEEFLDALSRVTGVWQEGPQFAISDDHVPAPGVGVRAWRIPADSLTRALGRPNREQVVTRRQTEYTTLQALELSNGERLAGFLSKGAAALVESGLVDPAMLTETVYRMALQRPPTAAERTAALEILSTGAGTQGVEDLLWAVAMLPEFQLIY